MSEDSINQMADELFEQILTDVQRQFNSIVQKQSVEDMLLNAPSIQSAYKSSVLSAVTRVSVRLYNKAITETERSDREAFALASKLGVIGV